jgi:uncharacterized protein (TIGR02246 family)
MNRLLTLLLTAAAAAIVVWSWPPLGKAQDAAAPNETAGLTKAISSYAEAFNKGDLAAVATHWATDAEYVSEAGRVTRGRDAIVALLKPTLAGQRPKLTLKTTAVRFAKPDVALVDVTAEYQPAQGDRYANPLHAVMVRTDGQWLITSVRDLPESSETEATAGDRATLMPKLAWLVGTWTSGEKAQAKLTTAWAPKGVFLVQEFQVPVAEGEPLTIWQRIGFDPLTGQIKSWVFDSRGGYGEGTWSAGDGGAWIEEVVGVLPDGRVATSVNVWQPKGEQQFVWKSYEREVEGQALPDRETTFSRKAD